MKLKEGVQLLGIQPQVVVALLIAESIWKALRLPPLTVTSVSDGKHSQGSLHYKGMAVDLRVIDIPEVKRNRVVRVLREWLGDEYDVVLETNPPHIHVEWDPKR